MALKPVLKHKVDELFLRWLSETETQYSLKDNLKQLIHGETITQHAPHIPACSPRGKGASPRNRPTSPTYATSANKLPSPRSPRRPLTNKNNHAFSQRNGNTSKVSLIFHLGY